MPDFWQTSGFSLLRRDQAGMLEVTDDFLKAYFSRPEIHPIEESCDAERHTHQALIENPRLAVEDLRLAEFADRDTAENYRMVLALRDHLVGHDSVESAYLALIKSGNITIPPVFLDQLVHVIARNMLENCTDPIRLRAAEVFFRDQHVNLDDGRIMLADDEIVTMYGDPGAAGGLGQLLSETDTPMRSVELDVLDEDNAQTYWERSNRFDMVVDFRFTQPALDAFARVIEVWIAHFMKVKVRVQPREKIEDERWSWHVGLDAGATDILNRLYEGQTLDQTELARIIALFRMEFEDPGDMAQTARGKPVYLALALDGAKKVKMKPQNLLVNLPLSAPA